MQMVDVYLPSVDGRQLVLPRYTQPDPDHQLLLQQLKLNLPAQPPPRICIRPLSYPPLARCPVVPTLGLCAREINTLHTLRPRVAEVGPGAFRCRRPEVQAWSIGHYSARWLESGRVRPKSRSPSFGQPPVRCAASPFPAPMASTIERGASTIAVSPFESTGACAAPVRPLRPNASGSLRRPGPAPDAHHRVRARCPLIAPRCQLGKRASTSCAGS